MPWPICSEKLSVFAERELKRVALLRGLGSLTLDQVEAELPRQGVITSEIIDGRMMATTDSVAGGRGLHPQIRGGGARLG